MKIHKNKNQLLMLCLAVGFFVGIFYENIIAKKQGASIEFFQPFYMEQYKSIKLIVEEYAWYVVRIRLSSFILFCLLGCLRWKRILVFGSLFRTAFITGVVLVSSMLQLGAKGLLVCIGGSFPHVIFYALSYGMILIYMYHYPHRQWNGVKTIFVILTFCIGIVLEIYFNPVLLKLLL